MWGRLVLRANQSLVMGLCTCRDASCGSLTERKKLELPTTLICQGGVLPRSAAHRRTYRREGT